jgi:hypothetical protein
VKDINLVIEFYGDYWHRNPKLYEDNNGVRKYDELRKKYIIELHNPNIIEIWESDYLNNKEKIIENTIKKIKKIYGNI